MACTKGGMVERRSLPQPGWESGTEGAGRFRAGPTFGRTDIWITKCLSPRPKFMPCWRQVRSRWHISMYEMMLSLTLPFLTPNVKWAQRLGQT